MPDELLMIRKESHLENAVVRWAEQHDILCLKFTPMGQRGWPDRIFMYRGRVVLIEFKAEKEKPRLIQKVRLDILKHHKVPAIWSSNFDESVEFLRRSLNVELPAPPVSD